MLPTDRANGVPGETRWPAASVGLWEQRLSGLMTAPDPRLERPERRTAQRPRYYSPTQCGRPIATTTPSPRIETTATASLVGRALPTSGEL